MHTRPRTFHSGSSGFTLPEILIALVVGTILTAIAVPLVGSAMASMHLQSMVNGITSAISRTRYQAIMNSKIYTLAITAPADTYQVTDVTGGFTYPAVPLPNQDVALNGGTGATYTFTLCPNGTVYGAGGACPGNTATPSLAATIAGREIDISVSQVGDVTTKTVH